MKIIKSFESYTSINEAKKDSYEVGDIVYIEYWYVDDENSHPELHKKFPYTPVEITEKKTNKSFKVSHNVENSKIKNAPDEVIQRKDILQRKDIKKVR
jgi:hypothetical protein